jgi:hypothetical protein
MPIDPHSVQRDDVDARSTTLMSSGQSGPLSPLLPADDEEEFTLNLACMPFCFIVGSHV